jgi:hypothetical protein
MQEIEKDTGPLPKMTHGRPALWPFAKMTEKGMFFFVPESRQKKSVLQSTTSRANKQFKGKRFSVVTYDQNGDRFEKNGEKGCRVYRMI